MTEHISPVDHFGPQTDEHELVSVVVEYDERPDQCTIYHPESNGIERMSSWITADRDCFVDLYSSR